MKTAETIIAQPAGTDKIKALKAFMKALNIKFKVHSFDIPADKTDADKIASKEDILGNIKAGLEEMQLFKKGKLKTTSAKDFLNEL